MRSWLLGAVLASAMATSAMAQQATLRAENPLFTGTGDPREQMMQVLAREPAVADAGLGIEAVAGDGGMTALQRWDALAAGALDIAVLRLDLVSEREPLFAATHLPGLVLSHDRAERLNHSGFLGEIRAAAERAGVLVLADAWYAGGFVSVHGCIGGPPTATGQRALGGDTVFAELLAAAGALVAPELPPDPAAALRQGELDLAAGSVADLAALGVRDVVRCLSAPGARTLWFAYEPVLISKRSWDRLTSQQQAALATAGAKAEAFMLEASPRLDAALAEAYASAGVEVSEMAAEDLEAWLTLARETSWRRFAESVPDGAALLDEAKEVE